MVGRFPPRDDIGAAGVEFGCPAGFDDDRRCDFLDDGWPLDSGARAELRAIVDRRASRFADCGKDAFDALDRLSRRRAATDLLRSQLFQAAERRALDIHRFDRVVALGIGVEFLVAPVERLLHCGDRFGVDLEIANLDGAFMHLSDITHVDAAPDVDLLAREVVGSKVLHALRLDVLVQLVDRRVGFGVVEADRACGHGIVFHVRNDLAERAQT